MERIFSLHRSDEVRDGGINKAPRVFELPLNVNILSQCLRNSSTQECPKVALGKQSPWIFGLNRLIDEVRTELLRDITRSLRVLWFIL